MLYPNPINSNETLHIYSAEKIKEYAHRAYLKRKEKLQKEKDLGINTFN